MKLSVVISAYNEETKIEDCLKSLKQLDAEIILVDNESTDKTVQLAKKYTSKIFSRPNNPMLNINKNYGFSKTTGDWILSLDADERVSAELAEEIRSIFTSEPTMVGYWIPRKNIIFGKWIQNSIWWPDYQLRLFKKGTGKFPEKHVHEMIEVDGNTEKLENPMVHENYTSVTQYLYKMDKIYTESETKNFLESGKKLHWSDAIRFPVADFLKTFFLQKGYKDGLHGLVLSMLQAFYAEVVFVKIWEKQGFTEYNSDSFLKDVYKEFKRVHLEFEYWFKSAFIGDTNSKLRKGIYKILRRRIDRKIKKHRI